MNYWLIVIINLFIILPAVTGLVRFSKINRAYWPFLYCLWLGALVEITSILLAFHGFSNAIISNVYTLIESILIMLLFHKWEIFEKRKYALYIIIVMLIIFWVVEVCIVTTIFDFCSYFRIFYSFIIVMMSISTINRLIIRERKILIKNPTFLLCIGFVFYYTLQIMVEAFWISNTADINFSTNIYNISVITNFITNLLYTVAILWIPIRLKFTLPSS